MKIVYDMVPCHRCGGGGRMPFAIHRGVCFGCHGKGERLSPAGKRAYKKVQEIQKKVCVVAASSLKVGDKIMLDGRVCTVKSVSVSLGKGNGISRSGVAGTDTYSESWVFGNTTFSTNRGGNSGAAHREVTMAWTKETLSVAAEAVKKFKGATVVA